MDQALSNPDLVLSPNDVFIAVMGLTGSGKSTFVNLCTQKEIPIGHHLQSCTSSVSIYSFQYMSTAVHLIDSPGFNDTMRSESEVLQELAYWLSEAYGKPDTKPDKRFLLNGIIYLHSIADNKWNGSTRRSLNMLKSICGPKNYDAIVLTTTFWDQVDSDAGVTREEQLKSDSNKWGQLIFHEPKSTVRRHDKGYKSAISVIDLIVKRSKKYELLIQRELARPGATLRETTAGREAQMQWEKDIEKFQEDLKATREAFNSHHDGSSGAFKEDVQKLKLDLTQRQTALTELLLPKEVLETRWVSKNNFEVELLQQKIVECQKRIEKISADRDRMETASTLSALSRRSGEEAVENRLRIERQHQKQLMTEKMAKLASRSLKVTMAGVLFGGASTGLAALPMLAMCCVM